MTYPLPSGWQEKKIIDISEVTSSKRIYEKEYVKNGIPFYRGKEISLLKNKEKIEEVIYISEEKYTELKNKYGVPQKNDILITAVGTIGNAYMVDNNDPFYFKDGNLIWLKNIKEHPKFLTFLFEYNQNKIIEISMGSSQKALTIIKLENLSFYFPPLEEQKRIAEVLSLCDDIIENLTELIDKKEQYKKGVMQRLLSGEVRFKGFTDEWKTVKLKDILIAGSKDRVNDTSKYKKITIKLHNKGIEFANIERKMADKRPFYIRKKDEIIIGKQNYFNGSIAIVNEEFDNTICSNAIMSFKVNNSCNNKFIYSLLSRESYMKKYYHLANGTGQKELSENDFFNFTLSVPSLEEQKKIAGLLSAIDEDIENLKKQLELRKQQKKGLMQKLLTGEVRV